MSDHGQSLSVSIGLITCKYNFPKFKNGPNASQPNCKQLIIGLYPKLNKYY